MAKSVQKTESGHLKTSGIPGLTQNFQGASPIIGAIKVTHNCTFIGRTKNTGHRLCEQHTKGIDTWDLVAPAECGSTLLETEGEEQVNAYTKASI